MADQQGENRVGQLGARLAQVAAGLSAKQRRLAEFLVNEPWQVAFSSSAEVGARTGVTGATVVRFAQSLGYQGFTELQEEIRGALPRFTRSIDNIRAELHGSDPPSDLRARVFESQIENLERSAAQLSPADFERAVELIVAARRVIVAGSGLAEAAATHAVYELSRIGIDARPASQSTVQNTLVFVDCDRRDLLIAIGYIRYVRDTIESLQQAVRLGMRVLAVTDTPLSPLARPADVALTVIATGLQSSSIVATIALVDALAAVVALRDPERSTRTLRRYEDLYHHSADRPGARPRAGRDG